ncbi:hypothetical protein Plarl_11701 [Candidatus Vecturithrix granuli]|uniref:YD repeat protein n=1 Tax=Vecturithrix granuli TaxID=1499967 RepID=A0A0S6WAN9_VECG1|nr:hypothetical protein Plarl_11701 [Candidatus Vecturithrix granuli]
MKIVQQARFILLGIVISSLCCATPQAHAATYRWKNGVTGSFHSPNWCLDGINCDTVGYTTIPNGSIAYIVNGIVSFNGGSFDGGIKLGSTYNSNNATFIMNGGVLNLTEGLHIYQNTAQNSEFILNNGSVTVNAEKYFRIYEYATFTQKGGTLTIQGSFYAPYIFSTGRLLITGGSANFATGGNLLVNQGEVSISGDAQVSFDYQPNNRETGTFRIADKAEVEFRDLGWAGQMGGIFKIEDSAVQFKSGSLTLGMSSANVQYDAPPQTTFTIGSGLSFANKLAQGTGLENTHLNFDIPSSTWGRILYNDAVQDKGCAPEGFVNNNALGKISVQGGNPYLQIDEVLYVHDLYIPTNGRVNVGGTGKLRYAKLTIESGGQLTVVPPGEACQVNLPTEYHLTTAVEPAGGGSITASPYINCPDDCSENFSAVTEVTLTATPAEGYLLKRWGGSVSGNSYTLPPLTMNKDYAATAYFIPKPTLTVSVEPAGAGTVTGLGINCPDDCAETYDTTADVTLTATAADGYALDGWQGAVSGKSSNVTVKMNGDKAVKVIFKQLPPPTTLKTGKLDDPVNTATGEYYFDLPVFDLGGPLPLSLSLYYGSMTYRKADIAAAFGASLGYNWLHNFALRRLDQGANQTAIIFYDGEILTFTGSEVDGWELLTFGDIPYQLKNDASGNYYLLNPITELVYVFNADLRLDRIMDRNGNTLTCAYDGDGLLTQVSDGLGRALHFSYTGGRLNQVCDGQSRCVTFGYSGNLLTSLTDPMGQVTQYEYDQENTYAGLMTRMILPKGNRPYTQTYDAEGRVIAQTDADDNATTLSFDANGVSTVNYPDATSVAHTHVNQELLTGYTDQTNQNVALTYDAAGRRTGVTDRLGGETQIAYDAGTGKETAVTNSQGDHIQFSYAQHSTSFGAVSFFFSDLSRVDYPDGTFETLTCDNSGNVLTRRDRQGNLWTSTYNARGQTLTVVNPAGGATTYSYAANGNLASFQTSDASPITYTYNAYNQRTRVTAEDGRYIEYAYNLNNWVLSLRDQRGHTTHYAYDANGNVTSITDPDGHATLFTYDDNDRLIRSMDAAGNSVTYTYDSLHRVNTVTQADGNVTTFFYTPQGWMEKTRDAAGREVTRQYDAEGMLTSIESPLGHRMTYTYDALGRLVSAADDSSHQTVTTYDAAGRVLSVTDAAGMQIAYTYNQGGLLNTVTVPTAGQVSVQRDVLGNVTGLTDFNGNTWNAGYSVMGNLTSMTDPLAHQITYAYDTMGRLITVTYPTGEIVQMTYDLAGNILQKQYSSGLQFTNTYDASNRLLTTNALQFGYDAEGRMLTTTDTSDPLSPVTFGATYNAAGRLNTVSYNNNLFTVSYAYDQTGRLTAVTDDLTGATVQFEYDQDSRLTAIRRPNNVHTTLEWDAASRLTRLTEGAFADLRYTLDAVGRVTQAELTLPLDPSAFLTGAQQIWTHDAASQIATAGYAYDANGRLTASPRGAFAWDGAGRLIQTPDAVLTYNGVDDVITREADGVTTHYYYHHAIDLTPLVAERTQGGAFTRYYVWSPSGMLLYAIDAAVGNQVVFYHFDRDGNTLALTNAAGTMTDAYTYTPYGQVLGHTGSSKQPFTFVGKFGVRQEGDSGASYHMRSRYYDAETGRFSSRDAAWPDLLSPLELNPYAYALLNPVGFSDPAGTSPRSEMLKTLWKELGDLWGLVKPTKTQLVGNTVNGRPENFIPGGAEWKDARAKTFCRRYRRQYCRRRHGGRYDRRIYRCRRDSDRNAR